MLQVWRAQACDHRILCVLSGFGPMSVEALAVGVGVEPGAPADDSYRLQFNWTLQTLLAAGTIACVGGTVWAPAVREELLQP
jgi:hypothetical protein